MLAYEAVEHVRGLVPFGLTRHIVGNLLTIDDKVLEPDVADHTVVVVAGNDAHVGFCPCVGDVSERDVFDASSRSCAVFAVEADTEVEEHAFTDVLDVDVVEEHVMDEDVVAVVDTDAALIVDLVLCVVENVNVCISHVGDFFLFFGLTVESDHDGVSDVSPVDSISDVDIPAGAVVAFACAIDRGAVVARAGEEMMLANIRGSKDVKAIAPSIPAHNLTVAYFYRFAATDGDLRRQWTVDEHVL